VRETVRDEAMCSVLEQAAKQRRAEMKRATREPTPN
jgi:hypothetical protein